MFTPTLKQIACSFLLFLGGVLAVTSQVNAANNEILLTARPIGESIKAPRYRQHHRVSRSVLRVGADVVTVFRDRQRLRLTTSKGDYFNVTAQGKRRIVVNINGVRQVYPVERLEQGRIRFSKDYLIEYRTLWASEIGDMLAIPEDPDVLFSISFWEAVGCGAGALGTGAVATPWAGGIVGAACLAYFDDHSIVVD